MPSEGDLAKEVAPPPREAAEPLEAPPGAGGKPSLVLNFNLPDDSFLFAGRMMAKGQTAVLKGKLKELNFLGLMDVTSVMARGASGR